MVSSHDFLKDKRNKNVKIYVNGKFYHRDKAKISVLGLGYVGLPIALKFSKKLKTYGFDTNIVRIKELQNGYDKNGEYDKK